MAESVLAITEEYVQSFMMLWQIEFVWSPSVIQMLINSNLDHLDVVYVIKNGEVVHSQKDETHDTIVTIQGKTCEDVYIEVTFSANSDEGTIEITDVEKLQENNNVSQEAGC